MKAIKIPRNTKPNEQEKKVIKLFRKQRQNARGKQWSVA